MRRKIRAMLVADVLVTAVVVATCWWCGSYGALVHSFFPMLLGQLLTASFLYEAES